MIVVYAIRKAAIHGYAQYKFAGAKQRELVDASVQWRLLRQRGAAIEVPL
jgi:hypothetical protein